MRRFVGSISRVASLSTFHSQRWNGIGSKALDEDDDFVATTTVAAPTSQSLSLSSSTPLGVQRSAPVPDDQEHSRLGVPLQEPRRGKPAVRENSRSLMLSEAKVMEAVHERKDSQYNDAKESKLPYDDEDFAETILAMEVEGALDETWQDKKKAHLDDVKAIVKILTDMRVRDVCAIDVSQKTSSFDYLIVGTCEGSRHIHLAAWAVQEADQEQRISKIPRQQTDHLWEVVPVGRIVVNLMQESYRNEINVERKWAVTKSMDPLAAANAPVSEGRNSRSHGLWTLTLNLQDLEDFEVDYCKDILMSQR